MKAEELYDQAMAEQKAGNNAMALSLFTLASSLLPENESFDLKFKIYLGKALLYSDLGAQLSGSFSTVLHSTEKKRNQIQEYFRNAILYFTKAISCLDSLPNNKTEKKGSTLLYRAQIYEELGEQQRAHDDYTAAYRLNRKLADDKVTTPWKLKNFVKHFPEFYQKTLKPQLSTEQLKQVKKMQLPETTLEGFEIAARSLPENTDRNTKLQIYLDCAVGYRKLAFDYHEKEKYPLHHEKAIKYYREALQCVDNDATLKGDIYLWLADLYNSLGERQNAHDNYTQAFKTNPNLVKQHVSDEWLKHFIKRYPDFYEKTFEPLLSPGQKKSGDRIKLAIHKKETTKKFEPFKTKIPLFSSLKAHEQKSAEERPDSGNYVQLPDDQQRRKSFP